MVGLKIKWVEGRLIVTAYKNGNAYIHLNKWRKHLT